VKNSELLSVMASIFIIGLIGNWKGYLDLPVSYSGHRLTTGCGRSGLRAAKTAGVAGLPPSLPLPAACG